MRLPFKKRTEQLSSAGNPDVETQLVDGGQVLLLGEETWNRLLQGALLDGLGVGEANIRRLLSWGLEFCGKHRPIFRVCLYKPGPNSKIWFHCVLFGANQPWQRVHIEHLRCEHCGWSGDAANPSIMDLYLGVPDKVQAIQASRRFPVLPCPKCGRSLPPRTPIWVDRTDLDLQASRAQLVTVLRRHSLRGTDDQTTP